MKKLVASLCAITVAVFSSVAVADLVVKDGNAVSRTIKNFVCETTKLCNSTVLIKSDGTEIGTSSAEVFVGGRGTAGSAAGGVLTVQGSASGTAVPVSLASVPSHAVTNAGTFAVQSNGFTSWAGGTLGAMAAYGTSPGAVNVPGVNAYVTNTLGGVTMGDAVTTGQFPTGSPVFSGLFNGTTYDRARSGGVTGMQGVSIQASPTGGCTPNTIVTSAASTNAANVKASAGTLCDWSAGNTSTTLYWVHFYNTAGTPTCNTGIIESYPISAAPAVGQVGGWSRPLPQGRAYSTGIGICITANADGTGNAAASAVTLNIGYK